METDDLTCGIEDTILNIRTSGLLKKENKLLLHKKLGDDSYALVGGRIKTNEDSETAVCREYQEELAITIEVNSLLWVVENFYQYGEQKIHEILFVYHVETCDHLPLQPFEKDGSSFVWAPVSEIKHLNLRPDFLKKKEDLFPKTVTHVVNRDKKEE